jgi:hypothetical protein
MLLAATCNVGAYSTGHECCLTVSQAFVCFTHTIKQDKKETCLYIYICFDHFSTVKCMYVCMSVS